MPTTGGLLSTFNAPVLLNPGHHHVGIDIGAAKGTPIYSIGPGEVTKVWNESNNKAGGNSIYIKNINGISSYYAHLDSVNVSPGDTVDGSTIIGTVGSTGVLPGGGKLSPHLHFQVKINANDIDPLSIIGKPINVEAAVRYVFKKLAATS